MFTEILPNIYRIEVPLPRNPLKAVNSYLIKAHGQSLIIDTGMNRMECLNTISFALRELEVDMKKADFFITHMHADHSGLASSLATSTSRVYISEADGVFLNSDDFSFWEEQSGFASINGFPKGELKRAIETHPGYRYSSRGRLNFHFLKEGNTIGIGNYLFKCIETPGHTRGHMCLYEPSRKLLIAGDHILIDITPNISLWSDDENPLDEYLRSLSKVYDLDVRLVLPGHRDAFQHFKARIRELENHHQRRANEVLAILQRGPQSAFQVASQMSWDVPCEAWDDFPSSQKWFATGEALAHLKHLQEQGKIQREIKAHKVVFLTK